MKSTIVTFIIILLGLTVQVHAVGELSGSTYQYCKGTCKNPTDNLSAGVATFGNDLGSTYCDICKSTVQRPHIHGPCPICHGTGKTR